ncbi:MAG: hypothetical protein IPO92_19270 [Saprospiraceae bacterium]|nr:hypothetical protein [Saprospiraceae bacterium]
MTSLAGLNNLTTINNTLGISYCDNLADLSSLLQLNTISGSAIIQHCPALINFNGLNNLTTINLIYILNNAQLNDVSDLQNINITSLTHLDISNNPVLAYCSNPNFCTYLDNPANSANIIGNVSNCASRDQVIIVCHPNDCGWNGDIVLNSQQDLFDFFINYPVCNRIRGNVRISGNDIVDVTPFLQITKIDGKLQIENNPVLTSLQGMQNIVSVGSLEVLTNPLLTSLAFNALTQTDGDIFIGYNWILADLSGLSSLSFVDGDLFMWQFKSNQFSRFK